MTEKALVENAQVTLQGGTAILPRYYNCTVTAIQQTLKINGFKNSLLNSDSSNIEVNGSTNSIINASHSSLTVNHGENNVINSDSDTNLTFNNGTGNTFIRAGGKADMYGADGLNLTFTSISKTVSTFFTAGDGNETLNAGTSNGKIELRANTVAGAKSNLVASTGDGDDMLYAGTGNSTFSGGGGNNVFAFFQNVDIGGNTVITDFGRSTGNHIWLANYHFNQNDVLTLLSNSHNDANGNAVINLNNTHQITLEGVSINDMKINDFIVNN